MDRIRLSTLVVNSSALGQAGLVTGVLFGTFLGLTYASPLRALPSYPAVLFAFVLWNILPGWFLQRALFHGASTKLIEQVLVAFLFSLALGAIPGLIGLRLHWTIETFGFCYAAIASLASGFALIIWPEREMGSPAQAADGAHDLSPFPTKLLTLLIVIPLLAVVTSPWWEDGRVAGDADDLVSGAFVREYSVGELNAAQPFQNQARGAYGRAQLDTWVVHQALLVHSSGVEPLDLLEEYLPPVLVLLVVAATYALARGLLKSEQIALLACFLLLAYAASDLASHDGFGRNVFLRVSQDKMVASFILFPLSMVVAGQYVEVPSRARYVAVLLAIAALGVTHPLSLMFYSASLGSLLALLAVADRSSTKLISLALVVVPVAAAGLGLFLASRLSEGQLVANIDPFRRGFHISDLPFDLIVSNYHVILHPFLLLSLLLAPVIWLRSRHDLGIQLLFAMASTVVIIMFIPPVATVVADLVNEEGVWRAHWFVPSTLIIAIAVHKASSAIAERRPWPAAPGISEGTVVLIASSVVVLGSVFVMENYVILDNGQFYNRTSSTELLPWTDGSILLGGAERAFSSDWRTTPLEQGVLDYLADHAEQHDTVLLDPRISTRFFPSTVGDLQIGYNGAPNIQERRAVKTRFYSGELKGEQLLASLQKFGVTYVIVASNGVPEEHIQAIGVRRLGATERFAFLTANDFTATFDNPTLVDQPMGWRLSADARDRVAGAQPVAIPEEASNAVIEFDVEVTAATASLVDTTARLVVTLFPAGTNANPIDTVLDLEIPAGTPEGTSFLRIRSPVMRFDARQAFDVSVWRDGQNAIDTYPGSIVLNSLDVRWFVDGPPLGTSSFHVYGVDTATPP